MFDKLQAYCSGTCSPANSCLNGGYLNPNGCSTCICPGGLTGQRCDEPFVSRAVGRTCGGEITATRTWSTLQTPDYPQYFTGELFCSWIITGPQGRRLVAKVNEVQFGNNQCRDTCSGGYVEVKFQQNLRVTGARLCCRSQAQTIISESNRIIIILKGNVYTQARAQIDVVVGLEGSLEPEIETPQPAAVQPGGQLGRPVQPIRIEVPLPAVIQPELPPPVVTQPDQPIVERLQTVNVWNAWSQCDRTCGACGRRVRGRGCTEGRCREVQQQRCAFTPCPSECGQVRITAVACL